jgi:hypothetical protein
MSRPLNSVILCACIVEKPHWHGPQLYQVQVLGGACAVVCVLFLVVPQDSCFTKVVGMPPCGIYLWPMVGLRSTIVCQGYKL